MLYVQTLTWLALPENAEMALLLRGIGGRLAGLAIDTWKTHGSTLMGNVTVYWPAAFRVEVKRPGSEVRVRLPLF
jgi:hypothetical protein